MAESSSRGRRRFAASRRGRITAWVLLCLAGLPALAPAAKAPVLHTDTQRATAGYYHLTWDWSDTRLHRFELQEAPSSAFVQPRTLYRGPDRASLLSGRRDGEYFYRVRLHPEHDQPGPWSDPVKVEVEHHSLDRAFTFFAVGAGVFLATLGLVVGGNLKSNHKGNG